MPRIPEQDIERLKAEISVERLVEAAGIELKKGGKDRLGRCPFHEDGEPSLVVTPAKNLWHCFGCGVGGGPIDWVMKAKGVSFRHAVEVLKADPALAASSLAARPSSSSAAPIKRTTRRVLESPVARDADEQTLLDEVVEFYHQTLLASSEARAYLVKRGIADEAAISTFKLGYANRTLGLRLPLANRRDGEAIRGRLQKIGLIRASGHEHFNGSLVIPVVDDKGHVTEVYGRKIGDNLRPGTPEHLYLPGPHRGVWNLAAFTDEALQNLSPTGSGAPGEPKAVVLCEALIDALTFWCAGYKNVTAIYGTQGYTADHAEALRRHGIKRVVLAFDRDAAGDEAAANLAHVLHAQGIEPLRVLFPHGMDANEYALKVQPASQSLGALLRGAQWIEPVGSNAGRGITRPAAATSAPIAAPAAVPVASAVPEPSSAAAKEENLAPSTPSTEPLCELTNGEATLTFGDRRWRVRGLAPEPTPGQLKINLLVAIGEAFHVDTLDLYSARARGAYLKQAAAELAVDEVVLKRDLGAVLLKLEALQADAALAKAAVPATPRLAISDEDKVAALTLLRDPNLAERIVADLGALGLVGEDANKLIAYLACVSRLHDKPLAVMIQSTSAAGKSSLMDAVLALMPAEERIHYAAMTGQSLFYMGETNLKHKILAIAEEQGVAQAAYALKLLQSQGELTIASTGKDETSGKLVTHTYRVEGPVMLFLTTTAIEVDEELLNRCLLLTVNESRDQTRAIHQVQRSRRTLAGLISKAQRSAMEALHQNAQRLLRPLPVVNPYAERLAFADGAPRTRRDHEKYLSLIDAVTLLHQHQRPIKTVEHAGQVIEYLEVSRDDIALADRLAAVVLGSALDELPPQTRKLWTQIEGYVAARAKADKTAADGVRFTRRELRAALGCGDTQLKLHLARLADMEFLRLSCGLRGGFTYQIADAGRDNNSAAAHDYDRDRSGLQAHRSGVEGRPVGVWSGVGPTGANPHECLVSGERSGWNGVHIEGEALNGRHSDAAVVLPLAARA
jgi:DNA primase catalytic core